MAHFPEFLVFYEIGHGEFDYGVKFYIGSNLMIDSAHAQLSGQNGPKRGQIGKNSSSVQNRGQRAKFCAQYLNAKTWSICYNVT